MKAARTTAAAPLDFPNPSAPRPAAAIPNPAAHPAVERAAARLRTITAELAAVRAALAATAAELGAGPGEADHVIEGRRIAEGLPTDGVALLRDYRHREKALAHAAGLVEADVAAARATAAREYTAAAREAVFLPAAREAVAAWLAACRAAERFRNTVERLHSTGVGGGTHTPFSQRVPLDLADPEAFAAYARELVRDGLADADQVNAAVPGAL